MADTLKWIVALAIGAAAVVAFYLFPEESTLFRVLGLLAAFAIVLAIAYQTQKGRETWAFLKESRTEVRKVVWPTRRETMQTTAIVLVIVSILAVALWLLDAVLTNAIQALLNVES